MTHLDLLGTELKSEVLTDLFETYDVKVIYSYDRTSENLADEYHAGVPELGLEFIFNDFQVLRTLFIKPVEVTTFNPFEPDEAIKNFTSKKEARQYAQNKGEKFQEGTAEFMGEEKDWIRFDTETASIHYEFVDSVLSMITLQRPVA